jgi:thiamine phosphate synthase YjbQ (UPF0047 family)
MSEQKTFGCHTRGDGTDEFSAEVERLVRASKLCAGTRNLFLQHTNWEID